jgi:hypothetical protein
MRAASALAGVLLMTASAFVAASSLAEVDRVSQRQAATGGGKPQKSLSDGQIRKILIDESIAAYSGNCPCPYSTARNGSRCGKRSAWSRAGGEEPLCYAKDVSAAMVQEYRNAHAAP